MKTDLLKLLEEAQALLDTGRNASSSSDASSGSSTRKKNISLDDFAREFNCKVVLERIDGHPSSRFLNFISVLFNKTLALIL